MNLKLDMIKKLHASISEVLQKPAFLPTMLVQFCNFVQYLYANVKIVGPTSNGAKLSTSRSFLIMPFEANISAIGTV
jgi:hypothetical protein